MEAPPGAAVCRILKQASPGASSCLLLDTARSPWAPAQAPWVARVAVLRPSPRTNKAINNIPLLAVSAPQLLTSCIILRPGQDTNAPVPPPRGYRVRAPACPLASRRGLWLHGHAPGTRRARGALWVKPPHPLLGSRETDKSTVTRSESTNTPVSNRPRPTVRPLCVSPES